MQQPLFLAVDPQMLKTEERILVAAVKVFADHPLETATVRQIAKEAGVNFSAITYYFKTKENLYREVISRVLDYVIRNSSLQIDAVDDDSPGSEKAAKQELKEFINHLCDWIYGKSQASLFSKIIMREHVSPSEVYDVLYEGFFSRVLDRLAKLVRTLCKKLDDRQADIQAFSIVGQVIIFRIEREMFIRKLDFTGFSLEEVEELKKTLHRNIFRQLGVRP